MDLLSNIPPPHVDNRSPLYEGFFIFLKARKIFLTSRSEVFLYRFNDFTHAFFMFSNCRFLRFNTINIVALKVGTFLIFFGSSIEDILTKV